MHYCFRRDPSATTDLEQLAVERGRDCADLGYPNGPVAGEALRGLAVEEARAALNIRLTDDPQQFLSLYSQAFVRGYSRHIRSR